MVNTGYFNKIFLHWNIIKNLKFDLYKILFYSRFGFRQVSYIVHSVVYIFSVLARISKGQGATSEKGTFMRKRWLKKGTLMHKDLLFIL